jgi:hypothetical protein
MFGFSNSVSHNDFGKHRLRQSELRPERRNQKVKIAPFRFSPLRNFFNPFTPPFFAPHYFRVKPSPTNGTKNLGTPPPAYR